MEFLAVAWHNITIFGRYFETLRSQLDNQNRVDQCKVATKCLKYVCIKVNDFSSPKSPGQFEVSEDNPWRALKALQS